MICRQLAVVDEMQRALSEGSSSSSSSTPSSPPPPLLPHSDMQTKVISTVHLTTTNIDCNQQLAPACSQQAPQISRNGQALNVVTKSRVKSHTNTNQDHSPSTITARTNDVNSAAITTLMDHNLNNAPSMYNQQKQEQQQSVRANNAGSDCSTSLLFVRPRYRWYTNDEIATILTRFDMHPTWLERDIQLRPQSGALFLYSRKKVRYRQDGYCWKKRRNGKTTREDHMKLKVQGIECIYGCYVHSAIVPTFHRRCYWLLQNPDIVLVHYLNESNGSSATLSGTTASSSNAHHHHHHHHHQSLPIATQFSPAITTGTNNVGANINANGVNQKFHEPLANNQSTDLIELQEQQHQQQQQQWTEQEIINEVSAMFGSAPEDELPRLLANHLLANDSIRHHVSVVKDTTTISETYDSGAISLTGHDTCHTNEVTKLVNFEPNHIKSDPDDHLLNSEINNNNDKVVVGINLQKLGTDNNNNCDHNDVIMRPTEFVVVGDSTIKLNPHSMDQAQTQHTFDNSVNEDLVLSSVSSSNDCLGMLTGATQPSTATGIERQSTTSPSTVNDQQQQSIKRSVNDRGCNNRRDEQEHQQKLTTNSTNASCLHQDTLDMMMDAEFLDLADKYEDDTNRIDLLISPSPLSPSVDAECLQLRQSQQSASSPWAWPRSHSLIDCSSLILPDDTCGGGGHGGTTAEGQLSTASPCHETSLSSIIVSENLALTQQQQSEDHPIIPIIDYAPNWSRTGGTVKLLLIGDWTSFSRAQTKLDENNNNSSNSSHRQDCFNNNEDRYSKRESRRSNLHDDCYSMESAAIDCFTVAFDDTIVNAVLMHEHVLRCYTPAHKAGFVNVCVLRNKQVISDRILFEYCDQVNANYLKPNNNSNHSNSRCEVQRQYSSIHNEQALTTDTQCELIRRQQPSFSSALLDCSEPSLVDDEPRFLALADTIVSAMHQAFARRRRLHQSQYQLSSQDSSSGVSVSRSRSSSPASSFGGGMSFENGATVNGQQQQQHAHQSEQSLLSFAEPTSEDFCDYFLATNEAQRDLSCLTLTDDEQRQLFEAATVIQTAYRTYVSSKQQHNNSNNNNHPSKLCNILTIDENSTTSSSRLNHLDTDNKCPHRSNLGDTCSNINTLVNNQCASNGPISTETATACDRMHTAASIIQAYYRRYRQYVQVRDQSATHLVATQTNVLQSSSSTSPSASSSSSASTSSDWPKRIKTTSAQHRHLQQTKHSIID